MDPFTLFCRKGEDNDLLAMLDMMKNSRRDSLKRIIERQHLSGGIDLFEDRDKSEWKYSYMIGREQFLKEFYQYCRDNPDFSVKWSDWVKNSAV